MEEILLVSLQGDDIYSWINAFQVAILLDLQEEGEANLVIMRMITRFYKRILKQGIQVEYQIKNVTKDKFVLKT